MATRAFLPPPPPWSAPLGHALPPPPFPLPLISPPRTSSSSILSAFPPIVAVVGAVTGAAALPLEPSVPSPTTTSASIRPHAPPPPSLSLADLTTTPPYPSLSNSRGRDLVDGVRDWLLPPPAHAASSSSSSSSWSTKTRAPTNDEIKLLREALGALYGERNPEKAEVLLTKAIAAWERQPPDERAALYRVRGDARMELNRASDAEEDYGTCIDLLDGPGGDLADPAERPAARLGRARAIRSRGPMTEREAERAAEDYAIALRLTSRGEWDTDAENVEDGAYRNPYAAWEWGSARRAAGDSRGAAVSHALAGRAFEDVGDRARGVISELDAGIDLAASGDAKEAKEVLGGAIGRTTSVEGRDVELLQKVIAKEGEARVALASVLWSEGRGAEAEAQLGEACLRLDQLEADARARERARAKSGAVPIPPKVRRLKFSIDDSVPGPGEIGCSRFRNDKFVADTLGWPAELREKLGRLETLGK